MLRVFSSSFKRQFPRQGGHQAYCHKPWSIIKFDDLNSPLLRCADFEKKNSKFCWHSEIHQKEEEYLSSLSGQFCTVRYLVKTKMTVSPDDNRSEPVKDCSGNQDAAVARDSIFLFPSTDDQLIKNKDGSGLVEVYLEDATLRLVGIA
jgi:hypothetical protein